MVALIVLKVPIVSISMTALKPFGLRAERGETKLPAAPALDWAISMCCLELSGQARTKVRRT